jgi:replicative DNA helicase
MAPQSTGEKFVLTAAIQGRLTAEQLERLREDYFEDAANKTIFSIIKNDLSAGQPIDFGQVATHLRGEAELTLLSELSLTEDIDDRSLQRIDENLLPMERTYLSRRMQQIQRQIIDAGNDDERLAELYQEKTQLSRMLHSLK